MIQIEDPSQNVKMSHEAMNKIINRLFITPPWCPDLNPIENAFHLPGVCLRNDANMNKIRRGTYEKLSNRVLTHLINFMRYYRSNKYIYAKTNRYCEQNERTTKAPLGNGHNF